MADWEAAYNRLTERSLDNAGQVLLDDKSYSYNSRNQLTAITDNKDNANSVSYSFDANGNQTLKSKNGVVTTFLYDVRDQLISVQENTTTLGMFYYDYQGMRVAKDMGGQIVRYSYDGKSVLTQSDVNGQTIAKYEYGPDQLLSMQHAAEGRQYYLFDALGSVSNLTNTSGMVQARYQYDAFGNLRAEAGSSFNRFTFTGHEKDSETGLYYFKARFYDPDTGRFLNQDPYLGEINTPPSLHRYLYAYSNPVVYVDLYGYESLKASLEETKLQAAKDDSPLTFVLADMGQSVLSVIEAVEPTGTFQRYNERVDESGTDGAFTGAIDDRVEEGKKTVGQIVEDPMGATPGIVLMAADKLICKGVCDKIGDKIDDKFGDKLDDVSERLGFNSPKNGAGGGAGNGVPESGAAQPGASGVGADSVGAARVVEQEPAANVPKRGPYRGGPHSQTKGPVGDGLDSHHLPDRNADLNVSLEDGPAIQMDPEDHWLTSSNGQNGRAGAIYRDQTADMINQGNYRGAMAREIRDVRRAAAEGSGDRTKYNEAIREMLDYARTSGQLPVNPRTGR